MVYAHVEAGGRELKSETDEKYLGYVMPNMLDFVAASHGASSCSEIDGYIFIASGNTRLSLPDYASKGFNKEVPSFIETKEKAQNFIGLDMKTS